MSQTSLPNKSFPALRRDFLGLWILLTTAVVLGLLINQFRDSRLPAVYQNKEARLKQAVQNIVQSPPAPSSTAEAAPFPEQLSLQEFESFVGSGKGVVLDARPEIFHRLGHVPKAISLPREDFENAYQAQRPKLEADKNIPIAIYCSGGHCEDSDLLKTALVGLGFRQVAIFRGGWAEWTNAGLPGETAQ